MKGSTEWMEGSQICFPRIGQTKNWRQITPINLIKFPDNHRRDAIILEAFFR